MAPLPQVAAPLLCPSPRSNPLSKLMACKRTSNIVEYQDRFEALLPCVGTLIEAQKVKLFTVGLQRHLRLDGEIHNPQTLAVAMSLARKLELRDRCATASALTPALLRPHHKGILPTPQHLPLPTPSPPTTPPVAATLASISIEKHQVKLLSQAKMEERRCLGLCFNCNEKFGQGHNRVC